MDIWIDVLFAAHDKSNAVAYSWEDTSFDRKGMHKYTLMKNESKNSFLGLFDSIANIKLYAEFRQISIFLLVIHQEEMIHILCWQ